MTGWRIGEKDYDACDRQTRKAAIFGVICAVSLETIFALAGGAIMTLFSKDPEMISLVKKITYNRYYT